MPKTKKQASWNFLRENQRLKGILDLEVQAAWRREGISLETICKIQGLHYYKTRNYLRMDGPTPNISNYDIVRLALFFDIHLDVEIISNAGVYGSLEDEISRHGLGSHGQTQIP